MQSTTAPNTTRELLGLIQQSRIIPTPTLVEYVRSTELPDDAHRAVMILLRDGMVSGYQAKLLMDGRNRGMVVGNYIVMEQLNSTSLGSAYLGKHMHTGEKVCLKVVPKDDKVLDPQAWFEFVKLSPLLMKLNHPRILKLVDVITVKELHVIVFELFDARSLEDVIKMSGPFAWFEAVRLTRQIGEALHIAHSQKIYHGNLRANKVLLGSKGQMRIYELGMAQCKSSDPNQPTKVQMGPKSDVQGLGITLRHLMLGMGSEQEAPSYLPVIPDSLKRILNKMVAADPAERYSSVSAVLASLKALQPLSTKSRNAAFSQATKIQEALKTRVMPKLATPMFG